MASMDSHLLTTTLSQTAEGDPLIQSLLKLYDIGKDNRKENPFILNRCDYIMDREGLPKLVEYNLFTPGSNIKS